MGQASLMSQVLPQDEGNRFRMPDLPPAGGEAVNYGYTPTAMATPSSMGMPNLNLQAPEFGIVDPTYLAQLAILNQGAGSFVPAAAPVAPVGLLGAGLESQEQFRANAPLLGGAPMIADWRAYSPQRSANALLNQAIADGGGSYEAQTGRDYYMDPTSYTGGLVQSLVNSGTYAPVVDMTTVNGQPSPTYGTVSLGGDMGPSYGGVGGGYEGSINNSMSQSDMLNSQEAGMGTTNDGTYCCSRMVDLNLWSENKQLARMHVWHHKQAKWWRAGYSVWGKVVANTLFKKKGFWTDVMDDFYNYHVKSKPRTLKSTIGDLVIYPGVAVCSLFVQEAPATTRYVAQ